MGLDIINLGINASESVSSSPSVGFVGLSWSNYLDGNGIFTLQDENTITVESFINTGYYDNGCYMSEVITGDFTFSLQTHVPNNQGHFGILVLDEDGGFPWAPSPSWAEFIIGFSSYAITNGGNQVSRRGYPSWTNSTTAVSNPATLTVTRTGDSISASTPALSSGVFNYSNPIRLGLSYNKWTGDGNSSSPNTITLQNGTFSN